MHFNTFHNNSLDFIGFHWISLQCAAQSHPLDVSHVLDELQRRSDSHKARKERGLFFVQKVETPDADQQLDGREKQSMVIAKSGNSSQLLPSFTPPSEMVEKLEYTTMKV